MVAAEGYRQMRISAREKRFLLVGGLAVVLYLAAVYVVEPFISDQLQVREDIRKRARALERHQLVASEKDRIQRKVEALRAQLRQAEALQFPGEKPPLVAAEIQGLLHTVGQEAGITFARENVPAPKKVEMLTQVTVELSVRGELRAIRDFLYMVQAYPKLLTVPRLTIRGAPARGQQPLLADLHVAGFTRGGEEKGSGVQPAREKKGK